MIGGFFFRFSICNFLTQPTAIFQPIGKQVTGRSKLSISLGGGGACVTRAQARRRGNQSDMKAVSSMSRWKPEDDYLLLRSVLHLRDLLAVHKSVKFTCVMSPADVTERWRALLFNPCVSQ